MRQSRALRFVVPVAASAIVGGLVGWSGQAAAVLPACTPTVTTVSGQTVVSFTTVGECVWTMPSGATHISVLVVGGGGSGGRSDERSVGGGGGGGVAVGTELALSGTFVVTVGAGGTNTQACATWPESSMGGDSSIVDAVDLVSGESIVAAGGARGAGCGENGTAASGGSGGGGHSFWVPNGGSATKGSTANITGVTLYGNAGGDGGSTGGEAGGGGGGAGGAGADGASGAGGDGGEGVSNDITGTMVVYGSGGGGIGTVSDGDGGTNAGDGLPAVAPDSVGAASVADAVANTGGGGGGAYNTTSGSGGSGIVVIRYTPAPSLPGTGSSTSMLVLAAGLLTVGIGLTAVRRRHPA